MADFVKLHETDDGKQTWARIDAIELIDDRDVGCMVWFTGAEGISVPRRAEELINEIQSLREG
jgi:hypothetical protein